jgi:dynein light intermediate chain 1
MKCWMCEMRGMKGVRPFLPLRSRFPLFLLTQGTPLMFRDRTETLARLSLFQLPSPSPPFPSLLSLALTPQTLLTSLIVLVLDWERPWNWVAEVEAWVGVLEEKLGRKRGEKERWEEVEGRERLEQWIRGYSEPPAQVNGAAGAGTSTSTSAAYAVDLEAELPKGSLTDNLGVGLVIVCTKVRTALISDWCTRRWEN